MKDWLRQVARTVFRATPEEKVLAYAREIAADNDTLLRENATLKIRTADLRHAVARLFDDNSRLHAELTLIRGSNLLLHDKIESLEGPERYPLVVHPSRPSLLHGNPHNTFAGGDAYQGPLLNEDEDVSTEAEQICDSLYYGPDFVGAGLGGESRAQLAEAQRLTEQGVRDVLSVVEYVVNATEQIAAAIYSVNPSPRLVEAAEVAQRVRQDPTISV